MNDDRIIKLYFDRSEDAITETDKKYGGACRSVAYNILGSHEDSEECVNDTYMRVWDTIPPKRPSKFGAFVVGIARHIALDMCRAASRLKNGGGYRSVGYDEILPPGQYGSEVVLCFHLVLTIPGRKTQKAGTMPL